MPKKPSLKSLDAELAKIQKLNKEKLDKIEEKNKRHDKEIQRQKEEFEQKKKRTKKIIITCINGLIQLENVTIDINESIQTLINLIFKKLKFYNISSIVINNISCNLNDMKYNFYEKNPFLLREQLNKYFNIDNEKDVIEITIVCGSIKHFLQNFITYFIHRIIDMEFSANYCNSDSEYIDYASLIKAEYKWFKNKLKKILILKYDFFEIFEEILLFLQNFNDCECKRFIINELKMLLN